LLFDKLVITFRTTNTAFKLQIFYALRIFGYIRILACSLASRFIVHCILDSISVLVKLIIMFSAKIKQVNIYKLFDGAGTLLHHIACNIKGSYKMRKCQSAKVRKWRRLVTRKARQ